jgi:hypothetical protein
MKEAKKAIMKAKWQSKKWREIGNNKRNNRGALINMLIGVNVWQAAWAAFGAAAACVPRRAAAARHNETNAASTLTSLTAAALAARYRKRRGTLLHLKRGNARRRHCWPRMRVTNAVTCRGGGMRRRHG